MRLLECSGERSLKRQRWKAYLAVRGGNELAGYSTLGPTWSASRTSSATDLACIFAITRPR